MEDASRSEGAGRAPGRSLSAKADYVAVKAVFFDVGETLIDETGEYGTWADWLGVPRHTFSVVFGAVLARGLDYREVFQHFRPGFDLTKERQRRIDDGIGEYFNALDLYPDAKPTLDRLHRDGYLIGIAGNQTKRAGNLIRELGLSADLIATSDDWGVEKPSPEFFQKLCRAANLPPNEILYVGDRLDNDIAPAKVARLRTARVRRGPWANVLPVDAINEVVPDIDIATLADLPQYLSL